MSNQPSLLINNLAFAYPDGNQALYGVNLRVEKGERVALLGPNGAGKTTVLNMITGILKPSRGNASIYGNNLVTDIDAVR